MSVVEGLPFAEEKKKYILEVLDPILEEMVSDVLTEMPKVPLDFMIAWLRRRSGVAGSMRVSVAQKNAQLKQELKQITGSLEEAGTAIGTEKAVEEDEEEESDDECDEIPESFKKPEAQMGRARQSVSAEAYGTWNQKKAFTAPKHPKTEEQKERLNQTLQKSFMFHALEKHDMETVLMAMKEVDFEAGKKVITEGEDGDYLFVIEKGSLDCIKSIEGADKVVKTCEVGDVFGELALLYNCPRAASVRSREPCLLWQLDRGTFIHIVRDSSIHKREQHEEFLAQVPLLESLGKYERSQIADALQKETVTAGTVVIKQGEEGSKFYLVEEGELSAQRADGDGRASPSAKKCYKRGDYFGELALLEEGDVRAATVVADTDAKLLWVERKVFERLLGTLKEVLKTKAAQYS
mmetsp:Transcript_87850/g.273292  ORF Transcript_87850/g.273292 Transcript_87850/m.273292 type:complete len:408 (-) Transcript_87850:70-1293(-)